MKPKTSLTRMGDVLIGEITITKSSHGPTNGFVGTLFIYAEETAMKKARQIVKPSATLFSKIHLETKNQGIYEDDY